MALKKSGLGKGLDSIFAENDTEDKNSVVMLKVHEVEPNRSQPRKDFQEEALAELADSIAQHGVLQPLWCAPLFDGGYQIVAGNAAGGRPVWPAWRISRPWCGNSAMGKSWSSP